MNISEKIMIFAGSDSAKELTEALSEQIDDMYVVSDDYYGKRQTIVGNITMLSRQMDEEDIKKWVERVGIKILIDGTQVQCKKASEQLRLAAEQNGLEYYKIQDKMEIDYSRAVKCKTADDIATLASNNVGRILMIGCESIVEEIVKVKDERLKNRVIAVLPPTEENIKRCKLSGYPDENIVCMSLPQKAEVFAGLKEGMDANFIVTSADDLSTLKECLSAAELINSRTAILGQIGEADGIPADQLWDTFAERFGLDR